PASADHPRAAMRLSRLSLVETHSYVLQSLSQRSAPPHSALQFAPLDLVPWVSLMAVVLSDPALSRSRPVSPAAADRCHPSVIPRSVPGFPRAVPQTSRCSRGLHPVLRRFP